MLAVIQHHQQLPAGQHPHQRLRRGHPRLLPHPQRHRHGRRDPRRIPHRGQLGQPRPVREPVRHLPGDLAGQPGLAHPARPGHRHQPVLLQQARDLAHRLCPADKARQHGRETMHAGGGRTRRRPLHPRTITGRSEPGTGPPNSRGPPRKGRRGGTPVPAYERAWPDSAARTVAWACIQPLVVPAARDSTGRPRVPLLPVLVSPCRNDAFSEYRPAGAMIRLSP